MEYTEEKINEIIKIIFSNTDICKPNYSGVYVVCRITVNNDTFEKSNEVIEYVGSSKNISKRILSPSHHYIKLYNEYLDDLVFTRSFQTKDFLNLEKELIKILKPRLNIYGK